MFGNSFWKEIRTWKIGGLLPRISKLSFISCLGEYFSNLQFTILNCYNLVECYGLFEEYAIRPILVVWIANAESIWLTLPSLLS